MYVEKDVTHQRHRCQRYKMDHSKSDLCKLHDIPNQSEGSSINRPPGIYHPHLVHNMKRTLNPYMAPRDNRSESTRQDNSIDLTPKPLSTEKARQEKSK